MEQKKMEETGLQNSLLAEDESLTTICIQKSFNNELRKQANQTVTKAMVS